MLIFDIFPFEKVWNMLIPEFIFVNSLFYSFIANFVPFG